MGRRKVVMENIILFKRIIYGIILSIIIVTLAIYMWKNNKNIDITIFRFLYKRVIPIMFIVSIKFVLINPLLDYFDDNSKIVAERGTLTNISISNRGRGRFLNEYSISIDGNIYYVPETLISPGYFKNGNTYTISYFKRCKLIYDVVLTD